MKSKQNNGFLREVWSKENFGEKNHPMKFVRAMVRVIIAFLLAGSSGTMAFVCHGNIRDYYFQFKNNFCVFYDAFVSFTLNK